MSTKAVFTGLFKRGKQVVQTVWKTKTQKAPVNVGNARIDAYDGQIARFRQVQPNQANKFQSLFRNVIPKIYYNSLARELSRRTALRGGRNVPLLAFAGLVFANTAKEEDEIATKIQNFIKASDSVDFPLLQQVKTLSLDQFEIGKLIGQGCNAAVYEARFKDHEADDSKSDIVSEDSETESESEMMESEAQETSSTAATGEMEDKSSEAGSDITSLSDVEGSIDENLKVIEEFQATESVQDIPDNASDTGSDFSFLGFSDEELDENERAPLVFHVNTPEARSEADSDVEVPSDFGPDIDEGAGLKESLPMSCSKNCLADCRMDMQLEEDSVPPDIGEENGPNVYSSLDSSVSFGASRNVTKPHFNLAVKMMFNYDVESDAAAILRQMDKEIVPARIHPIDEQKNEYGSGTAVRKKSLPPHPNIVEMWDVFVDSVRQLPGGLIHYPVALPSRISPAGAGRNMTLFLIMKRYSITLEDYLSKFPDITIDERLVLLTQLLEAVAHLRKHGVAHRDIKADNILLDINTDGPPQLVLTDFGCCLADSQHGLQLPFPTDEICRGGNTALMAPEIACAVPGMYSMLDYRKSDLWSVGAIAYQILGIHNPFYGHEANSRLDSRTYRESELPPLPDKIPAFVRQLVMSLLCREPSQRPTARQAADLLHLYHWSPSDWWCPGNKIKRSEVKWWLVTIAAEVIIEKQFGKRNGTRNTMKRSFLENLNMNNLMDSFAAMTVQVI